MNRIYLFLLSLLVSIGASAADYYIHGTFNAGSGFGAKVKLTQNPGNNQEWYTAEPLQVSNGGTWSEILFCEGDYAQKWGNNNGGVLSPGNYDLAKNGGNLKTNLNVNKKYKFYFQPNNNHLYVEEAGNADSGDYYIQGTFNGKNGGFGVQIKLVPNPGNNTEWYNPTPIEVSEGGSWAKILFGTLNNAEKWGKKDNNTLQGTGDYFLTKGGADIPTTLDPNKKYTFYFNPSVPKVHVVEYTGGSTDKKQPERDGYYYFYGDMNRWSLNQNAGDQITIQDGDKKDITKDVWPDDPDFGTSTVPYYYTQQELDNIWRFEKCAAPAGQSGDNWYKLDFSNIHDELGNVGRLCGQFKITKGFYNNNNTNNWGPRRDEKDELGYLKNKIDVNTPFTTFEKATGLQNFQLNCSYVQDAVLYFNPTDNKIIVTGTPVTNYVYYVKVDGGLDNNGRVISSSTVAPQAWEISDMSQVNYYVNTKGFNSGANGYTDVKKDDNYNVGNMYQWEEVTNPEHTYNGISFTKAYRRIIPYGAFHRFPVEFNVHLRGGDGTEFDKQTVSCDNLWFVEASVNLFFRYESGYQPDWVAYNAFSYNIDTDGVRRGNNFAYGGLNNNNWQKAGGPVSVKGPNDDRRYLYFRSHHSLPVQFASDSYALFLTSEGALYPLGGVNATGEDLLEAAISGTDLYYVVPENNSDLEILYSHLKGSYDHTRVKTNGEVLQIQAELFDEDGVLDTTYQQDHTKYAFMVYKYNRATDNMDMVAHSGTEADPYVYDPYFNWTESPNIAEAGFYYIVVRAKKHDKIFTATDIYPIFVTE